MKHRLSLMLKASRFRLTRLIVGLCFILIAKTVFANPSDSNLDVTQTRNDTASWYDVELVIFATNERTSNTNETWPELGFQTLTLPEHALDLVAGFERGQVLTLPNTFKLSEHRERLEQTPSRYRVLYQNGWRQQVHDPAQASTWFIAGGDVYEGLNELEGYLNISLQRYLHVQADLRLSQFERVSTPSKPQSFLQNLLPNRASGNHMIRDDAVNSRLHASSLTANASSNITSNITSKIASNIKVKRIIQLEQNRRMRSNELHYLDHPLMGMLITVSPADVVVFE